MGAGDGLPPGVTEVSRVAAPDGGFWVLGSDGGVFALGGASFYGSYPQIASTQLGTRGAWKNISVSDNGGYIITDDKGGHYEFNPPPSDGVTKNVVSDPTGTTQSPTDIAGEATAAAKATSDASGSAILSKALTDYGLPASMGTDLLNYYNGDGHGSLDATMLRLRSSPEYKARFPALAARQAAGLSALDETTYLSWESGAKSQLMKYGLPADFYSTPDELGKFIAGDVSVAELTNRIEKGYNDALSAPPEVRNALQSMYGVDAGHLASFFLDPTVGQDIIQRKFVSSQIGGEANKAGFGSLTAAEGEKLGATGLTEQGAQQGFGQLGQETQLTQDMSREDQLAAVGGDIAAQQKIATEATKKKATFSDGGTFAGGAGGLSGLGTSNT